MDSSGSFQGYKNQPNANLFMEYIHILNVI